MNDFSSSDIFDRLFHSVVDTADAASEILKWINREPYENGIGLPGTFCFYPLDKIRHPNRITGYVCVFQQLAGCYLIPHY